MADNKKIELKEPSSNVTIACTDVIRNKGEFGESYGFVGVMNDDESVIVWVPATSADRQFDGQVKAAEECVGRIVYLGRSAKLGANGKPFWDVRIKGTHSIAVSKPAPKAPAVASGSPVSHQRSDVGLMEVFDLYNACLTFARSLEKDPTVVAAMTATLFIGAQKVGARPEVSVTPKVSPKVSPKAAPKVEEPELPDEEDSDELPFN